MQWNLGSSSWKPISDAIFEKYALKISATSPLSIIVLSPSRSMVWFPFLNSFPEKKGDIVRQKVWSCLAQLIAKYFAKYFLRSDTTWFRRRRSSSQYFLPNVRNFFRVIFRYKALCAIWSSYMALVVAWYFGFVLCSPGRTWYTGVYIDKKMASITSVHWSLCTPVIVFELISTPLLS